jgi:hypothetical protein
VKTLVSLAPKKDSKITARQEDTKITSRLCQGKGSKESSDVFARVSNAGMSDEDSAALIEDAADKAADEVRRHGYHVRQVEKDIMQIRTTNTASQEQIGAGNVARHEREAAEGRERNRVLKAHENLHGPKQRVWY